MRGKSKPLPEEVSSAPAGVATANEEKSADTIVPQSGGKGGTDS